MFSFRQVSTQEIISAVKQYLETHDIEPNTTISNFGSNACIALQSKVDHIIVGDYSLSVGKSFS